MVDLPQIEAFVAVATYGSFAKAAASMFLTQPSVSARVQALENAHSNGLNIRSFGAFLRLQQARILGNRARVHLG